MRKALQGGTAIALFPEGTFPDEHQINMLPFRDGSFTLAVDEACALHPVLFPDSSYRMHPKQVWRITPGINRLIFLPPLHGAGLVKKDIPQWSTYVRSYMQACLNYTRTHSPQGVWEYALQWLQKHTFEPA
ncbi:MAG TPA: hypothetical protein PLP34_08505, partial [Chitinophagaceae bacterium]|nr:hypothetical protein [Chitinophagaceae bacterium]